MKINHLKSFEKHVNDASPHHLSNIYLILGKDPFYVRTALSYLTHALTNGSQNPLIYWFDGEKHSIEDFLLEASTFSLLADRKIIGFQQLDKLGKDALKLLEEELSRVPKHLYLIFLSPTLPNNTSFYKKVEKFGVILEFPDMKAWEKEKHLTEWASDEISRHGKNASHQLCQSLVKKTGLNAGLLFQEIHKLLCYIGDRHEISMNDLKAILAPTENENVWDLGEAIFSRNLSLALKLAHSLFQEESNLFSLLRQLRSQFQTEYQVLGLYELHGASAVTQEFAYMKGQILEKHLKSALGYGRNSLLKGIIAIDRAELDAKNSKGIPEVILELLIVKLCI